MQVRDVHRPSTVVAEQDEPLIDVASRMRFNDVGSAIVLVEGEVTGIITERDLVSAVADGADIRVTTVAAYMTSDPATVASHVDEIAAATIMARRDLVHLPIVDDGKLTGVISQRDLVLELISLRAVS